MIKKKEWIISRSKNNINKEIKKGRRYQITAKETYYAVKEITKRDVIKNIKGMITKKGKKIKIQMIRCYQLLV